jgi:general stress protein 26
MENKENHEDLFGNEAIQKIQALVSAQGICHFVSNLSGRPLSTRPMSVQQVDDQGILWFFSPKSSEKNHDVAQDPNVQLLFSNHSSSEYLSIYGKAWIVSDKEKAKQIWSPVAKAWFKDGVDDPELTLIKVVPDEAYYWDTKNNKVISMLKILASVVTGSTSDDGVQGELKI